MVNFSIKNLDLLKNMIGPNWVNHIQYEDGYWWFIEEDEYGNTYKQQLTTKHFIYWKDKQLKLGTKKDTLVVLEYHS